MLKQKYILFVYLIISKIHLQTQYALMFTFLSKLLCKTKTNKNTFRTHYWKNQRECWNLQQLIVLSPQQTVLYMMTILWQSSHILIHFYVMAGVCTPQPSLVESLFTLIIQSNSSNWVISCVGTMFRNEMSFFINEVLHHRLSFPIHDYHTHTNNNTHDYHTHTNNKHTWILHTH